MGAALAALEAMLGGGRKKGRSGAHRGFGDVGIREKALVQAW